VFDTDDSSESFFYTWSELTLAPVEWFRFGLGTIATIGRRTGMVFVLEFSDFVAWCLWRTVYLTKLPGLPKMLRIMADWTFLSETSRTESSAINH
jgi:NADH dehydrogenase FAD-containing subunit